MFFRLNVSLAAVKTATLSTRTAGARSSPWRLGTSAEEMKPASPAAALRTPGPRPRLRVLHLHRPHDDEDLVGLPARAGGRDDLDDFPRHRRPYLAALGAAAGRLHARRGGRGDLPSQGAFPAP